VSPLGVFLCSLFGLLVMLLNIEVGVFCVVCLVC